MHIKLNLGLWLQKYNYILLFSAVVAVESVASVVGGYSSNKVRIASSRDGRHGISGGDCIYGIRSPDSETIGVVLVTLAVYILHNYLYTFIYGIYSQREREKRRQRKGATTILKMRSTPGISVHKTIF